MKLHIMLAMGAAFAAAACGQTPVPEPQAPAAPLSMMDQVLAMAPEQQPVFAWQQLTAYQTTHPEAVPLCASIRGAESRGILPADVDPASIYGPHAGALVYSIQCGAQLTGTRMDPAEHWLVVMVPGAAEPVILNCANAAGVDQCPTAIPRAAAPATP